MEADILSLAELRQLRKDQPRKLFNYLKQVERDFVFGVEDHRDEGSAEWGGEFRVLLNRNVELHLVPRFNEEMSDSAELPQFCIMPDSELAGTEDERSIRIDAEDSVSGVTFYVEPDAYDRIVDELVTVVEKYDDFDVIPDTYFLETELVQLITTRVLEHDTVKAERQYDFRRGLVGGEPPANDLEDEESTDLDHGAPPKA